MIRWFKGYFISSTYAQDISNQSCITNCGTPCSTTFFIRPSSIILVLKIDGKVMEGADWLSGVIPGKCGFVSRENYLKGELRDQRWKKQLWRRRKGERSWNASLKGDGRREMQRVAWLLGRGRTRMKRLAAVRPSYSSTCFLWYNRSRLEDPRFFQRQKM